MRRRQKGHSHCGVRGPPFSGRAKKRGWGFGRVVGRVPSSGRGVFRGVLRGYSSGYRPGFKATGETNSNNAAETSICICDHVCFLRYLLNTLATLALKSQRQTKTETKPNPKPNQTTK